MEGLRKATIKLNHDSRPAEAAEVRTGDLLNTKPEC
jgi:hypothetical protein